MRASAPVDMDRNAESNSSKVQISTLTMDRLAEVNNINNIFTGSTGKRCCGCISYGCCPDSDVSFRKLYDEHPESLALGAVAIHPNTNKVIGAIVLNQYGVEASKNDQMMYKTKPGEVYVSWIAVLPGHRGLGTGTSLMNWAETTARNRGGKKLTLGVVARNPAKRLYERLGFKITESSSVNRFFSNVATCVVLGCPHCGFGANMMEKPLT